MKSIKCKMRTYFAIQESKKLRVQLKSAKEQQALQQSFLIDYETEFSLTMTQGIYDPFMTQLWPK